MDTYKIDASGAWGSDLLMRVPKGWRMLGTIQCASDHTSGVLCRSPVGLYAQVTANSVRVLDERAVTAALAHAELTSPDSVSRAASEHGSYGAVRRISGTRTSNGGTMNTYTIDAGGAWRRYHPEPVPKGWRILGTIHCESDASTGALGRSPAGVYALINGGNVRILDQSAVAAALGRVRLPVTYKRGKETLG
jgi:hypothetical protein